MSLSHGTLFGGRIRYTQPARGYRTGIEPVLLAASVPARAGERVLEAGTGAGAGLLCLAARVPGVIGIGVEQDPDQAGIAAANFAANGFDLLGVEVANLLDWACGERFDHAFANPPWHDAASTPSPDAARRAAKQHSLRLLADWAAAMARLLRPRATLTLIAPATLLTECIVALAGAGCSEQRLTPLWPRLGTPAKIFVLQGYYQGRGASALLPGLVLHEADGRLSEQAQSILRDGLPLPNHPP